jgi:hypothetical protein
MRACACWRENFHTGQTPETLIKRTFRKIKIFPKRIQVAYTIFLTTPKLKGSNHAQIDENVHFEYQAPEQRAGHLSRLSAAGFGLACYAQKR